MGPGEYMKTLMRLENVKEDVVMVRTPDGSGRVELVKFHTRADNQGADASSTNRLGIRHIVFIVDDLNALVDKVRCKGMNTSEKSRTTMTSIGPATYAAPRESLSSWPSRSARREHAKPALRHAFRHRQPELRGDTVPGRNSSGHTSEHAWFGLN